MVHVGIFLHYGWAIHRKIIDAILLMFVISLLFFSISTTFCLPSGLLHSIWCCSCTVSLNADSRVSSRDSAPSRLLTEKGRWRRTQTPNRLKNFYQRKTLGLSFGNILVSVDKTSNRKHRNVNIAEKQFRQPKVNNMTSLF